MSHAKYAIGEDVAPLGGDARGDVVERRELDDGQWLYGVVDTNGRVAYYV